MRLMILSDGAHAALRPAGDWRRRPVRSLGADDAALWRSLGGPDPLFASGEGLSPFWSCLALISEAPRSQFDALREGRAEHPGAVACVARTGRRFHGHRGRPWAARDGNLHLCAALRPGVPAGPLGPALAMLPAVAVTDAIRSAGVPVGIKWVNDVLHEGRKVAGVLTATQSKGGRLDLVVLGIGVNVAVRPEVPPTPFVPDVGALPGVELPALLRETLDAVERRFRELVADGPASIADAYRERSVILGRRVRVYGEGIPESTPAAEWPEPLAAGVVRSIEPDLSLRIDGAERPIRRGRLAFEASAREFGLPASG